MLLRCQQTERGGKGIGNPEELDPYVGSSRSTGIARQSFLPREARVRPLRAGEDDSLLLWSGWPALVHLDLDALVSQEVHACSSMLSSAPVTPEQGSRTDFERGEQHTHLAGFSCVPPMPLTLLAHRTGTATAETGRIDHTQAPIGLWTLLVCRKLLPSWTAQRAIWLESPRLARRSGLASRARPLPEKHSPKEKRRAQLIVEGLAQTR